MRASLIEDLYPSRYAATPSLMERLDPVVHGAWTPDADQPLSRNDLQSYEDNGYLSFAGFFSAAELRPYQEELTRLWARDDVKTWPEVILEPGTQEVRSIFYIHQTNDLLSQLLRHRRILAIVKQLLGSEVYIHQSRINYKPGFEGKEFYWHSDFETWHIEDGMPRMRALSCSISLTENNEHNGPLMVIPGSHQRYVTCVGETPEDHYKSSLQKQEYGVPDHDSMRRLVEQGGIDAPKGPAGSVTFFDCNIMHGSSSNITPWPRSNIFCVYNSVENALVEPFGGHNPRPEFIATRQDFSPIQPV
jgi:ectoine hydroxylase